MFKTEDADIIKPNGIVFGPYKATFAGDTIIIKDKTAIIDVGDQVSRKLPNGTNEIRTINSVNFYDHGTTIGPHFQLNVRQIPASQAFNNTTQNIHVHGGNVQIGNQNKMEFINNIKYLVETIEKSNSSPQEKSDAKELLKKFLEHPIVTAIAGSAVTALLP